MAILYNNLNGDVIFTNRTIDGDVENTNHTIRGDVQQSLGLMSEWGKIVGDIDDQTDLKNALMGKADVDYVKNGSLSIERNGVQIASFTANDSNSVVADISVPEDVFLVNVTLTDLTTGTSDKSASDIFTAIAYNKAVFVKALYGLGFYIFAPLSWVQMGEGGFYEAVFVYEDQDNPSFKYCTLTIIGNAVTLAFKNGYITGIDSTMVTNALGFTPYSDANPDGFTSDSALTTTDIDEAIA